MWLVVKGNRSLDFTIHKLIHPRVRATAEFFRGTFSGDFFRSDDITVINQFGHLEDVMRNHQAR